MEKTTNYNLIKPGEEDFYRIDDFNKNADVIDQELRRVEKNIESAITEVRGAIEDIDFSEIHSALDQKVDKVPGKGLSSNDFTNTDKQQITTNRQDILDLSALVTSMHNQITQNTSKINTLWDALFSDITANPFSVTFGNLGGISLTSGVWNTTLQRLEC